MLILPTSPLHSPTGDDLRRMRIGAGMLTQAAAAWVIGMTPQSWNGWESGRRAMPVELFELWSYKTARAKALGVDIARAFERARDHAAPADPLPVDLWGNTE